MIALESVKKTVRRPCSGCNGVSKEEGKEGEWGIDRASTTIITGRGWPC